MAVHQLTITLTGSAQAISTPAAGQPSINVQELQLQAEANNAQIAVGNAAVTASDYGQIITANQTTPLVMGRAAGTRSINLASTYVIGTANQKLHVLWIS